MTKLKNRVLFFTRLGLTALAVCSWPLLFNDPAHAQAPGDACLATGVPGTFCRFRANPTIGVCFVTPPSSTLWDCGGGGSGSSSLQNLAKRATIARTADLIRRVMEYGPTSSHMVEWEDGDWFDLDAFIRRNPGLFQEEAAKYGIDLDTFGESQNLGMKLAPGTRLGLIGGAGGAVSRGSGYAISDATGTIPAGARMSSFRETSGGGYLGLYFDPSSILPNDQSLVFRGFFAYSDANRKYATAPDIGINIDAGSVNRESFTFGGTFHYRNASSYYLKGGITFDVGRGEVTDNVTGGSGKYDTYGFSSGLILGKIFTLFDTGNAANGGFVKTPPSRQSPLRIGLDVSGRVGYGISQADGLTDSTGFVYGDERARGGAIGARAKLFAITPSEGLFWRPYLAASVDHMVGYSHRLDFPSQPNLVGGGTVSISPAKTFWGIEAGMDVIRYGQWRIGGRGFFKASSDVNIAGGTINLRVPLWEGPPALARR